MSFSSEYIRNIAIIAHVDHGKTTLVDGLIKQTMKDRKLQNMGDLIMDNIAQERERGITIKAKNASIYYRGYKINLVDTPGHADFGGEVERALYMVDGAVLLVDAQEGPMPQTRYVLKKAIRNNLKILVVINKVDKPAANCVQTLRKIEDLFLDLGASESQLDFPVLYASGVQGRAGHDPQALADNLYPFLDMVIEEIPAPVIREDLEAKKQGINPLQIQILNLHYDNFKGKMGVGKIHLGVVRKNQELLRIGQNQQDRGRVSSLLIFDNLDLREVEEVGAGEIVMVAGFTQIEIGDTLTSLEYAKALPRVEIDEPTIQMTFGVNTSPFAGREGKLGTSRQIRERLFKELETNVALRVSEHPESQEKFIVSGRGELHLSVLIENMRREGFELEVSRPEVIFKEIDGRKLEPYEIVEIDVPLEYQGVVMQELGRRQAKIINVQPNQVNTEIHFEARMTTRALIGLKSFLLTQTKGTVVMHSLFDGYDDFVDLQLTSDHGSLISTETGIAMAYALDNAQQRGTLFIGPGTEVYQGMVIGQAAKGEDLELNPCKNKQLTNMRSKSSDEAIILTPPKIMSLENCLEYIAEDELVEVTPLSLRIRKKYLDPNERKRQKRKEMIQ